MMFVLDKPIEAFVSLSANSSHVWKQTITLPMVVHIWFYAQLVEILLETIENSDFIHQRCYHNCRMPVAHALHFN